MLYPFDLKYEYITVEILARKADSESRQMSIRSWIDLSALRII